MAKHDVDPVFRELVRSVNESGQAVVSWSYRPVSPRRAPARPGRA